jgi:hypothetical protein
MEAEMDNKKGKNIAMFTPQIPAMGFLRVRQIIGDNQRGIVGIIPISRSGWYQGVRDGVDF